MASKADLSIARKFKSELAKRIPLTKMILFGSRAHGKSGKESDFDFIIVSPKFKKMEWCDRSIRLYDCWKPLIPIDMLCYDPDEFEKYKKSLSTVKQAVEQGIVV
ncbi:TPA: hypothetical protein HA318_03910 [Candidatus Micrarchaeota archaeon]|nr:MAG: hypothetical protein AUJ65_02350 [Candidatus Micrarchaeota archaeon CG1_02_51_15]HII39116.1 hypothetical protein [Candidatus Micrarchaeota archaeon]